MFQCSAAVILGLDISLDISCATSYILLENESLRQISRKMELKIVIHVTTVKLLQLRKRLRSYYFTFVLNFLFTWSRTRVANNSLGKPATLAKPVHSTGKYRSFCQTKFWKLKPEFLVKLIAPRNSANRTFYSQPH